MSGALAAFDGASLITLQRSIVMPALAVTVAGLLSYGFAVLWRTGIVERDRRALARAFRLYLPAAAVDRLLSAPRGPELGGEIRDVTVLFSDIANFTALAEKQNSHALVTALNGYFDRMAEIIEHEGGFIDKFIGDAIVAVFGAPAGPSDHAAAAMRAACAMAASSEGPSFTTRVGLNSGPVLIGNIGASRRFNYTVIGDTVNLASRLEGANKEYGTTIFCERRHAGRCANHRLPRSRPNPSGRPRRADRHLYTSTRRRRCEPRIRLRGCSRALSRRAI